MFDLNNDGRITLDDVNLTDDSMIQNMIRNASGFENITLHSSNLSDYITTDLDINIDTTLQEGWADNLYFGDNMNDTTRMTGVQNLQASQMDLGISSGAVGSRQALGRMLESYQGRKSLIQGAQRQKAIYTIDRFDGGLNLNKSPRDLSYWEACQMDELTPSKVGRLIRLGDFTSTTTYAMGLEAAEQENYGLHYFKWSDSVNTDYSLDGGSPSNYLAYDDGDTEINLWNFSDAGGAAKVEAVITSMATTQKPVYHSASNRLYVSDASFDSSNTLMCGIVDRRKLFPFDSSGTLTYNITGDSHLFKNELLYHTPPTKGLADGNIMVTGTQTASTQVASLTRLMNTAASSGGNQHHGIYMNVNFEDITGDESSGTGWGGTSASGAKYYKIYASFLYDDGSETKLIDVTSNDNAVGDDLIKATTTSAAVYQKLVIKQCIIDGAGIVASTAASSGARIHGARFYYTEVDSNGSTLGDDKYLFAELDFRYGLKLVSEFGLWNQFDDDNDGSGHSLTTAIQVLNALNANDDTSADGTLSILSPPTAFTYYSLNLFHQEEIKDDLLWATSTVGNGIAFIGNIEYDARQYPDTMLYSGAGETDAGSAYPMWGTFPVDSNRIDIPGAAGEITALKWTSNRVLQFRKNALYVVNVEDVLAPRVEGVYQGMGVAGQYAVTETPFGVAWLNENGAYAYNSEEKKARSLTIGRLDTEDFIADSTSKIGYDDRAKMLIVGNYTKRANASNYAYAYSFVTDAWCTWSVNRGSYTPISNFAIDHDGYLTGGTRSSGNLIVNKWSAEAQGDAAVDYITKDIDFGKPILDKRMYTLYISYTGGANNAVKVYFRPNGKDGAFLGADTIWYELKTLQDYTDPYGSTGGDDNVSISTTASLASTTEPSAINNQRLAKINLRSFATDTTNIALNSSSHGLPPDYFRWIRSIQLRFKGTAADTFEINDISLVYKEKRLK